jgi:putative tricarboxylic transport membrane protein
MKDIVCVVAGLALAIGYYVLADRLPRSLLSDPTGADGLPKLLAIALALISLAVLGLALLRRTPTARAADHGEALRHLRAAGMLAFGVAYFLLLPWLGYPLSVFLLLLGVILYAGTRPGVAPVAISAAGAGVLWFTFERLFGIAMPHGTLF